MQQPAVTLILTREQWLLHLEVHFMLCPPTNAVKTPLLGCLPNTEIILITSCALFFVSSRHNYGKFRLHGLQPSCQDTMPSDSLTCEIPIFEVPKKHGMRSKSSSPLEFFYWSSPKIMQKQLHLSLNSPCSNWKTDNNETIRSNFGSQERLPFLCLLTAAAEQPKCNVQGGVVNIFLRYSFPKFTVSCPSGC